MDKSPLIAIDPYLKPYASVLERRRRKAILRELEFTDGKHSLKDCINNHLYYGLHKDNGSWVLREKAPHAKRIFIYGDFSAWQIEEKYELRSVGQGDWEIIIPGTVLKHGMLYKLWILWEGGGGERIPAYATRVVQDDDTKVFSTQVWDPEITYRWRFGQPERKPHYFIYEAHVGMSSEKPEVSTYNSFRKDILPRIKMLGYNAIQFMAVQEHPYYGSFGYQVSSFFAPSSRFGTPEDLKLLIDQAHGMGIAVILDIVHSHAVSNEKEGLGYIDGSDDLYFFPGEKGKHPVWDSRLFDYGKPETISFLLSNIKYWMEEFRFDGLRFDGVTSMCYKDHGIGVDFTGYSQYFDDNVDEDAITYLTLANKLRQEINPSSFSIAEDVSGMPGLAFPVEKGGIGFDYRMAMGIADFWQKLIKESPDEKWDVGEIYFRMTDKRKEESTVSYAESHDQAMVGDKTIMFRLVDKDIYSFMSVSTPSLIIDRGIALHKIIRFLTATLANGGYLNFMGNEFGHPEWIDFPRAGNQWSYEHALRRWDLADNPDLKYRYLQNFDRALIQYISGNHILEDSPSLLWEHRTNQTMAYFRKDRLFVVNLSPANSYTDYPIPCPPGKYHIALNSDREEFGGFGNIRETTDFFTYPAEGKHYIRIYIPARTVLIFEKKP